jgi:hypothetical protein
MRRSLHFFFLLTVFSAVLLTSVGASAQATTKRLILKDGSYQVVTKWEIHGDRVHYYSAERSEWEDVPNSMVDWDATKQFEKDRVAGKNSPEALALDKELQQERQEEEARSPTVAPGLRLPAQGGVYALDTYLSEPQLLPLDQSTGQVNKNVKRNILHATIHPVSGSKMAIELPGARAKIQIHASLPTMYLNLDPVDDDAGPSSAKDASGKKASELSWDRFRIVRVQVKGDKRIVGQVKSSVTGKSSTEEDAVDASAEQLGDGWVKITPKAPLAPGEYALAEILGTQGINSYVWDFGVHPDAPANIAVIRPEQQKKTSDTTAPAASEGGNSGPPVPELKKRD